MDAVRQPTEEDDIDRLRAGLGMRFTRFEVDRFFDKARRAGELDDAVADLSEGLAESLLHKIERADGNWMKIESWLKAAQSILTQGFTELKGTADGLPGIRRAWESLLDLDSAACDAVQIVNCVSDILSAVHLDAPRSNGSSASHALEAQESDEEPDVKPEAEFTDLSAPRSWEE